MIVWEENLQSVDPKDVPDVWLGIVVIVGSLIAFAASALHLIGRRS